MEVLKALECGRGQTLYLISFYFHSRTPLLCSSMSLLTPPHACFLCHIHLQHFLVCLFFFCTPLLPPHTSYLFPFSHYFTTFSYMPFIFISTPLYLACPPYICLHPFSIHSIPHSFCCYCCHKLSLNTLIIWRYNKSWDIFGLEGSFTGDYATLKLFFKV